MAKIEALLASFAHNPGNVRFRDLEKVCAHFFGLPRQRGGSHLVFKTPWSGDPRVNIQNDHGRAKGYQVRQVLNAIERLKHERP